jgi:hypothetical protein
MALTSASPPPTAVSVLDRSQRCAGRVLLGFRRTAPGPAVLAELGWMPLSKHLVAERASLLGRMCQSRNSYISALVEVTAAPPESWVALAARGIGPWCKGANPNSASAWKAVVSNCRVAINMQETAHLAHLCSVHPGLASYRIVPWSCDGSWRVNAFLHNRDVCPTSCRQIIRLIVGGQDLRGGDPVVVAPVTRTNCCLSCLQAGELAVESLSHVVFTCPAYRDLRQQRAIQPYLEERDTNIFRISRGVWEWRELKAIRAFFACIANRRLALSGGRVRKAAVWIQTMVDELWSA